MANCNDCNYEHIKGRYKYEVEKNGEFEFITSLKKGSILPNGKKAKSPYVKIKHKYCGNIYYTCFNNTTITNGTYNCSKCCGKYENSFAYYIEQELGEPLEKYWDFEKNTLNPRHINRGSNSKVWIKCTNPETPYHGSYEVDCNSFVRGNRCPYCHSKKTHPKDSFAQYHIDNTDPNFLEKYWSDKNTVDPWKISPGSQKRVWIKCQDKDYHNDYGGYQIQCYSFTNAIKNGNNGCSYCGNHKVHFKDSFGYHNFDKVLSWHPDNKISPFRVAGGSNKKFKFRCETCENEWMTSLYAIKNDSWCPECAKSKGEKRIIKWLRYNKIKFVNDKEYFRDLKGVKGGLLRPDFILLDYKIWIEYDGEFHYKNKMDEDCLKTTKTHDKLKDRYAKKHGYKMIRIPYWDFDNIEEILEKEISTQSNHNVI